MTKVGKLFEEEKKNYAVNYATEQAENMVRTMLRDGVSIEKAAKYTNVPIEKVKEIFNSLLVKA